MRSKHQELGVGLEVVHYFNQAALFHFCSSHGKIINLLEFFYGQFKVSKPGIMIKVFPEFRDYLNEE